MTASCPARTPGEGLFGKLSLAVLLLALLFLGEALLTPHLNYALPFVGYGGTFRFSSVPVGGASLSLYWLAQGAGVVCMALLCLSRRRAYGVGAAGAVLTALLLTLAGYAGAKLLYIAENWERVLREGVGLSGVSFFGTVFFLPLAVSLWALLLGRKPGEWLDYCTPPTLLMLACIRIGCFMNGCCRGITLWVWQRPVILPSQLLECALDLWLLDRLLRAEKRGSCRGGLYVLFMGGYGALRFLVEVTRDTTKDLMGLSNGQWFSLACMAIWAGAFAVRRARAEKPAHPDDGKE